jgi:hypothetical protein
MEGFCYKKLRGYAEQENRAQPDKKLKIKK